MKRSKTYRKGEHVYVKSGTRKEVHTLQEKKGPECEWDQDYDEIYADLFSFEVRPKGLKMNFGKLLFGTGRARFKKAVLLDIRTAREFRKVLAQIMEKRSEPPS